MNTELEKKWNDFVSLGWDTKYHSKASFSFLMKAVDFSENQPMLDAGAGHQRFKDFFAKSFYISIEHPDGVKHKDMGNITYDLLSPIDQKIPLKDNSVACIYNQSVLEHVRYPEKFFAEAFRILSPGGKMFIHVPFAYIEHEIPYDFQRPTRYGLKRWFEDAGFEIEAIEPSSSNFYAASAYMGWALRTDLRRTGKSLMFYVLWPFMKLAIKWARHLTDESVLHGPAEDMILPIGWIAIAKKPGTFVKTQYKSKQDFLTQNKIN